ncbi:hypothetical protein X975_26939, partial [Stegodyphus mimosarum]
MVMMDIGSGHFLRLRSRTSILTGKIEISYSNINGFTISNKRCNAVSGCKYPSASYQGST